MNKIWICFALAAIVAFSTSTAPTMAQGVVTSLTQDADDPPPVPPGYNERSPSDFPAGSEAGAPDAGVKDYFDDGGSCDMSCGCGCCDGPWRLCSQCGPTRVYGWLDVGFMHNVDSPTSGYNGPYSQIDTDDAYLNQAYVVMERELDPCASSIGYRLDILYGTDFFLAQSKGFENRTSGALHWNGEDYGLAIPQAYVELGSDLLSIKLGHFYGIVGYETLPSVNNFFYSKSYSYMFSQPITHWGGIATYSASDRLSIDAGLVNGWDALDRQGNRTAFLGRIQYCGDYGDTSFAIITGDEPSGGPAGLASRTRLSFIQSLWLTCNTQYVFHYWYGKQDATPVPGGGADWYGIDQYLYYNMSNTLQAGARLEWFRDDDGTRIGLNRPSNPNKPPFVGSAYSATVGLNWTPNPNLTVRPEVRWDWFHGTGLPYNDGTESNQFLVGMDAIIQF